MEATPPRSGSKQSHDFLLLIPFGQAVLPERLGQVAAHSVAEVVVLEYLGMVVMDPRQQLAVPVEPAAAQALPEPQQLAASQQPRTVSAEPAAVAAAAAAHSLIRARPAALAGMVVQARMASS